MNAVLGGQLKDHGSPQVLLSACNVSCIVVYFLPEFEAVQPRYQRSAKRDFIKGKLAYTNTHTHTHIHVRIYLFKGFVSQEIGALLWLVIIIGQSSSNQPQAIVTGGHAP